MDGRGRILVVLAAAVVTAGTLVLAAGDRGERGAGPDGAEASTTSTAAGVGPGSDAAAVLAYEQALDPLAFEGGRIVYQGLRGGLSDLHFGEVPPEEIARMARTWGEELRELRRRMRGLDRPPVLDGVAAGLDEAMAGYGAAARALVEAAETPEAEREPAVDRVVELGEAADETWDRALAELATVRERLGITEPSPLSGVDDPTAEPARS